MGIDVGRVLNVVVRAQPDKETGERRQLFAGEVDDFEEAGRHMRQYRVAVCVVDALPETRKAREFQASHRPGRVWLAYYVGQKVGSKKEEPVVWDEVERVVNLDRTRTLDETMARFLDGTNTLPGNARDITNYYMQVKAPVRTLEKKADGDKVARYVETGPDHFAHAENYAMAASLASLPSLPADALSEMMGGVKGWGG